MNVNDTALKIAPYIERTDMLHSQPLSERFKASVNFKMENRQIGGSIKTRGGYAKLLSQPSVQHFTTASSGNHGISFSLAAQSLERTVDVFVPVNTAPIKTQKIEGLGANLILQGNSWDEANQACIQHANRSGAEYVNAFDDDSINDGYATAAKEILTQLPKIDIFVCSIGGGSIITGMSKFMKNINPSIKVYGVETYGAHSMRLSFANGEPTELSQITSQAASLAIKKPSQKMFNNIRMHVDGLITVSDHESNEARKNFLSETGEVIELAASCNIAALTKHVPGIQGKNIVVLSCGGNDDLESLERLYSDDLEIDPFLALG